MVESVVLARVILPAKDKYFASNPPIAYMVESLPCDSTRQCSHAKVHHMVVLSFNLRCIIDYLLGVHRDIS